MNLPVGFTKNIPIEFRHIIAFIAVAEKLNFKKASIALNMTQPGLTRIINRLEDDLGASLFKRTTRSVELTESGSVFLQEVIPALDRLNTAIIKTQNAEAGNIGYLRVAYMSFAINKNLPSILKKFQEQFPGIRLDLTYIPTPEQKKQLIDSKIDIGFIVGNFSNPFVEQLPFIKEELVAVLPEGHRLSDKQCVSISDLKDEEFILGTPKDWKAFLKIINQLCLQSNFNPKVRQYVDTIDGIFGMVAAKMGITIFAACASNFQHIGLVIKRLEDKSAEVTTTAVWLKNNKSKSLSKFLDFIKIFADESAD
ncbi:LysR family transcriptional regulator [Desulfotignum balticum]|uniref:LysR family transcriptional regulator n=1 Tax=Desulfotignum balticum TaxID=115781 RepID=UPI000421824A|nr:LysR family transcriptional regulator [Desulfotignum balticum]